MTPMETLEARIGREREAPYDKQWVERLDWARWAFALESDDRGFECTPATGKEVK